jgi:hypothetical protein
MHLVRLRTPRTAAVTAAVLMSTLLLGACDGAGSGSPEPGTEPAPAISVPSDLQMDGESATASEDASSDSEDDASPSPSSSASVKASSPEDEAAAQCAELQVAWAATNRALVSLSPEHPRSLVASFREAHRAITSVEPPSEIEGAWSDMTDYLTSAVEALEDVDADDAEAVTSAVTEALSAEDTARATAAAEEVTAYLADSCRTS